MSRREKLYIGGLWVGGWMPRAWAKRGVQSAGDGILDLWRAPHVVDDDIASTKAHLHLAAGEPFLTLDHKNCIGFSLLFLQLRRIIGSRGNNRMLQPQNNSERFGWTESQNMFPVTCVIQIKKKKNLKLVENRDVRLQVAKEANRFYTNHGLKCRGQLNRRCFKTPVRSVIIVKSCFIPQTIIVRQHIKPLHP